jgi:2-polyprenyl-6-methoxyphenol hydroxylase-like FAD-dependent oxidoreductase
VLALCLQKRNISVEIYETRNEDSTEGGNIALAPNALRVLDRLGAYETLRCQGFSYEELTFSNGSGTELGHFLNGDKTLYNFPALRIHRALVREELIRLLRKERIPIHWNKKCAEVVGETGATADTEGSATVEFEDGETATARFVIAADGIHSRLRPFVAPEAAKPSFSGLMGIMGTVKASELGDLVNEHGLRLPNMLFGANGSFAIMPSSFDGKEIGYFATIEADDRGREGWTKLAEDGNEMRSMLEDRFLRNPEHKWPELVRRLCEKTPTETLTTWP